MNIIKFVKKNINADREKLADVIPLSTPYSVAIWPIKICNFQCSYCEYSLPVINRNEYYKKLNKVKMELETFKKIINQLKEFPERIKSMDFAGLGEPLLHSEIANMIKAAKWGVERVSLYTNAALLSREKSEALADSGLDMLRISIQGVDNDTYKRISSVDIDLSVMKENIRYFYEHRKNTKVYIKILDVAVQDKEEEFIREFSPIADFVSIEHLMPIFSNVDYNRFHHRFKKTVHGDTLETLEVCSQPFYKLNISPNGDVFVCCATHESVCAGNVNKITIKQMWNGEFIKGIRIKQLEKRRLEIPACNDCGFFSALACPEDNIDSAANEILSRIK